MDLLPNFLFEYLIGPAISIREPKENKNKTFIVRMSYEDDLGLVDQE